MKNNIVTNRRLREELFGFVIACTALTGLVLANFGLVLDAIVLGLLAILLSRGVEALVKSKYVHERFRREESLTAVALWFIIFFLLLGHFTFAFFAFALYLGVGLAGRYAEKVFDWGSGIAPRDFNAGGEHNQ